jgi:hypothetical protein
VKRVEGRGDAAFLNRDTGGTEVRKSELWGCLRWGGMKRDRGKARRKKKTKQQGNKEGDARNSVAALSVPRGLAPPAAKSEAVGQRWATRGPSCSAVWLWSLVHLVTCPHLSSPVVKKRRDRLRESWRHGS